MKRIMVVCMTVVLTLSLAASSIFIQQRGRSDWLLGVDQMVAYSVPFSVQDRSDGEVKVYFRQTDTGGKPIRYALLAVGKMGDREIAARMVQGGFGADSGGFLAFRDIPSGNYRLQIYNYGGCMCRVHVSIQTGN